MLEKKPIWQKILDIKKELKDLFLVHHATIKDLQKQDTQMHRKIVTIESERKPTRGKTATKKNIGGKKTTHNKKPSNSIESTNKTAQKKNRIILFFSYHTIG
jgi:hypothetical protein